MKEVGEGEEQGREGGREGENVQKHRGVGGTECSGEREREKREGEVKDRGREHEEEAEEEGREAEEEGREKEEGEISSCQMVSNKTSASSQQPRLNSNIKKKSFLHRIKKKKKSHLNTSDVVEYGHICMFGSSIHVWKTSLLTGDTHGPPQLFVCAALQLRPPSPPPPPPPPAPRCGGGRPSPSRTCARSSACSR